MAAFCYEDVGGLDIAVDDAFGVRRIKRIGDVDRDGKQLFRFERPPRDAVLEGLPLQKLHGDEGTRVLFTDVVNRADVGMIERRGGLGLPRKTGESLGILGDAVGQKLERDKAVQPHVFGFVHHAHSAASQIWTTANRRSSIAFARPSRSADIDTRSMNSFSGTAPSHACRSTRWWSPVIAFSSRIAGSRQERSMDDSLQCGGSPTRLPTLACSVRSSPPASGG